MLVTSAYSHRVDGFSMGARLTFVDLTDRAAIRYRHVLLVEPFVRDNGAVDVRPVQVHAGGIVWHADYLHVAGTARGFSSFHLDDIVRAPTGDASRLRIRDESPATVDTFGHRYVLPVRFTYNAGTAAGVRRMRYSFASLDRSTTPHEIVVGEYGRGRYPTRLARYPIDPVTSLLHLNEGASHPTLLSYGGVPRMQGAAVVDGTWFVSTSDGPFRPRQRLARRARQADRAPAGASGRPGGHRLLAAARRALVGQRVPGRPLRVRDEPGRAHRGRLS